MALSKSNQVAFDRALAADAVIPGIFARTVSAMHRSANARQQAAIWDAITAKLRATQFTFINGALVAAAERERYEGAL